MPSFSCAMTPLSTHSGSELAGWSRWTCTARSLTVWQISMQFPDYSSIGIS
jgi:hypothetical protein